MSTNKYRTSRCILKSSDEFLLVVHNNAQGVNRGIWGLPGGRIDWGEQPVQAARREIYEELETDIDELHEVGDWAYKGYQHKIYGTLFNGKLGRIDTSEILEVDWFTLEGIQGLAEKDKLHAGFELESVERFLTLLAEMSPQRQRKGRSKSRK
jgi:8-oxo-dGTP pyrophosphatase MutT (NUDIX family)